LTPIHPVQAGIQGMPEVTVPSRAAAEKGSGVTSVVSLRTSANSSRVPIVVFVDMQQEYLAKPPLLTIFQIDRALDNCRKAPDHSRSAGLPVALIRALNESAWFNPATPVVRWIDGLEPYRSVMIFERPSPSCYSCEPFAALVNQSRGGMGLAGFSSEWTCDSDRRIPPQSRGHLSERCMGQSRARRNAGGRSPPRHSEDMRSFLWRGI
jgi:hypothetical protein